MPKHSIQCFGLKVGSNDTLWGQRICLLDMRAFGLSIIWDEVPKQKYNLALKQALFRYLGAKIDIILDTWTRRVWF